MSVIVAYERPDKPEAFIEIRDLIADVKRREDGSLSTATGVSLFRLTERNGSLYIIPVSGSLRAGTEPVRANHEILADKTVVFSLPDGSVVRILHVGATAEALSRVAEPVDSILERALLPAPLLTLSYAWGQKQYQLVPDTLFSVGSSDASAIYIPFPGIAAEHGAIQASEDGLITIVPKQGSFAVNGKGETERFSIRAPAEAILLPTGIKLVFSPSSAA